MKLNCKVGDLAIVVRSQMGNAGKIVKVISPSSNGWKSSDGRTWQQLPGDGVMWIVECAGGLAFQDSSGRRGVLKARPFRDADLRPIRDQPGEDETLNWVGLPQDAGVTA